MLAAANTTTSVGFAPFSSIVATGSLLLFVLSPQAVIMTPMISKAIINAIILFISVFLSMINSHFYFIMI